MRRHRRGLLPPPGCAACGREARSEREPGEIEIAPGLKVILCLCERYSARVPVDSCLAKARAIARRCPGCGKDGFDPGTICHTCRDAVARDKGADAKEGDLKWSAVCGTAIAPYRSHDEKERLGELLCRLLAAGTRRRADRVGNLGYVRNRVGGSSGDPWVGTWAVELPDDAFEALKTFSEALLEEIEEQRREARAEGEDVLRQLANGTLTVAEHEVEVARLAQYRKPRKRASR